MTQSDAILTYLKNGGRLTSLEALRMFGCMRLASRISDFKQEGHRIVSKIVHNNGKHFSEYRLIKDGDLF